MTDPSHEGGCLCGAVRYRVSGAPTNLCYCHCRSCRRAAGAHCVAWGTFDASRFELVRGEPARVRSSEHVLRSFCGACGSALGYVNDARPGELDLTLASLDDPSDLAPVCHIWVSHRLPWVLLADGLPAFPEWRR